MGLASGVGCVLLPPCYQRLSPVFLDRNRQVLVGEFRQFTIGVFYIKKNSRLSPHRVPGKRLEGFPDIATSLLC
jgi:hypothetical protein